MEYIDIYDEEGKYIGKEERKIAHRDALWHKTVHCWLYDKEGNVYFQMRKGEGLYTTASGHVMAGETVEQGFGREIFEEIGLKIGINSAILVEIDKFSIDILRKNGSMYRDRAFAHVFLYEFEEDYKNFKFDNNEIDGLVSIKAKEALNLLSNRCDNIPGLVFKTNGNSIIREEKGIRISDFLINEGETGIGKYGKVLNKVIELTETV